MVSARARARVCVSGLRLLFLFPVSSVSCVVFVFTSNFLDGEATHELNLISGRISDQVPEAPVTESSFSPVSSVNVFLNLHLHLI